MRKARRNEQIVFIGANIMLFQDLSQITLRNRRALRPLQDKLRVREIKYIWRFPFALIVNSEWNGHQYILHEPDDLQDFCAALDLGQVLLPDWYA